jgi:gamma-glutamylputrescine oxidase
MSRNYNLWFETYPNQKDIAPGLVKNVDILVIGGGLAGITLLYHLINSGMINTYLIEESTIGFHATGRSHGQLLLRGNKLFSDLPKTIATDYFDFIRENNKNFLHGLRHMPFDTDLKDTGGLRLASSEEEFARLEKESKFISTYGNIDCPMIGKKELSSIVYSDKFFGGMFMPNEVTFNPYKVVLGLKELIEKHGSHIFVNTQAESIVRNDDNTFTVSIRHRGTIKTKKIVYCTGAYINNLVPRLSKIVTPFRGQMIATEALSQELLQALPTMSLTCNNANEYIRLYNSRLLVGGMRHAVRGQQENIIYDGEISPSIYEKLRSFITDTFPSLINTKFTHTWSSIMCNTPDGLPLIGPFSDSPNEFIMTGFDAFGFSHIILGSEMIKNYINGKTQTYKAAELFKMERFNV